jgi:site-specific DNA-methyltransferase (adenine-specific)
MQNMDGIMKIDEATYKRMPAELQALFVKLPNPERDEVLGLFPETISKWGSNTTKNNNPFTPYEGNRSDTESVSPQEFWYDRSGSAARFFYCAKASRSERNEGMEGMEERSKATTYGDGFNSETKLATPKQQQAGFVDRGKTTNHHPTVKPIALMEYLCRLTKTPTGGIVLDPFMGSGTTGIAAHLTGREFIGIEQNEEYFEIAKRRIEHWRAKPVQEELI